MWGQWCPELGGVVVDGAVWVGCELVEPELELELEPPEAAFASAAPPPITAAVAPTTASPFAMPRGIPLPPFIERFGWCGHVGSAP
jgi:hypothetical protein